MIKCKKCKKEIEHPRRGMCLNCYRKETGLSKPKSKIKTKVESKVKPKIKHKKEIRQEKEIKQKKETTKSESKSTVIDSWWEKYLKADILEQQELLATLPLVKELAKNGFPNLATLEKYKDLPPEELAKEQEKFNSHMLVTMLYSYINDLIELKD